MPPELLGPGALLVAALIAVGVLWREHLRGDADDRRQRDAAMQGWSDHTKATDLSTGALQAIQRDIADIKGELRRARR